MSERKDPYFDEKTQTGWKQPDRKRMDSTFGGTAGWTYYENGKQKHVFYWKWPEEGYNRLKDSPFVQTVMSDLQARAEAVGDFAESTVEFTVEQAEKALELAGKGWNKANTIVHEHVTQIPSTWINHPDSMDVYGELLTHKEFNRRQYQDAAESLGWGKYK